VSDVVFALSRFVRHRPQCPEFDGPGDCTCGLYALLDTIRCTCGHKVNHHTNRDVDDVVGWPCSDCHSKKCRGFVLAQADKAQEPEIMSDHGHVLNEAEQRWTLIHLLAHDSGWTEAAVEEYVTKLEQRAVVAALAQPAGEGRCAVCGGGETYWKHSMERAGGHDFLAQPDSTGAKP
jgi:hypothetical protein